MKKVYLVIVLSIFASQIIAQNVTPEGVSADNSGNVTEWKDLSGNNNSPNISESCLSLKIM